MQQRAASEARHGHPPGGETSTPGGVARGSKLRGEWLTLALAVMSSTVVLATGRAAQSNNGGRHDAKVSKNVLASDRFPA